MSTAANWKTIGLEILQVHTEECGDGSCGCGCGEAPLVAVKMPEKAAEPESCCEPACGPETRGQPRKTVRAMGSTRTRPLRVFAN